MESTLNYEPNGYGFGYDWSLLVTTQNGTKNFYLGQDAKFCSRVLGMEPSYIVNQIGDNDLRKVETRKKFGEFIVETLGLTDEIVDELQPWELCCQ